MAKGRARPNQKTSTSAEENPGLSKKEDLGLSWVGKLITVMGRDVTLGGHGADPILHVGKVEAIHIYRERLRVVLVREGIQFNTTRVIEVTQ